MGTIGRKILHQLYIIICPVSTMKAAVFLAAILITTVSAFQQITTTATAKKKTKLLLTMSTSENEPLSSADHILCKYKVLCCFIDVPNPFHILLRINLILLHYISPYANNM